MIKFWFLFPCNVYASNFYGRNEQEARESARQWLKVARLPNGTQVWRD